MSEATMTIEAAPAPAAPSGAEMGGGEAVMTAEPTMNTETAVAETGLSTTLNPSAPATPSESASGIIKLDIISQDTTNSVPSIHFKGLSEMNMNATDRAIVNEGPVSLSSLQNSVEYQIPGVVEYSLPGNEPDAAPKETTGIIKMDVIPSDVSDVMTEANTTDPITTILPYTVPITADNIGLLSSQQTFTVQQENLQPSEPKIASKEIAEDTTTQPEVHTTETKQNERQVSYVPIRWDTPTEVTTQPIKTEPIEPTQLDAVQVTVDEQTNASADKQLVTDTSNNVTDANIAVETIIPTPQEVDPQAVVREQLTKEYEKVVHTTGAVDIQTEAYLEKVSFVKTPWEPDMVPALIDDEEELAMKRTTVQTTNDEAISQGSTLLYLLEEREKKKQQLKVQEQQAGKDTNTNGVVTRVQQQEQNDDKAAREGTDNRAALLIVKVQENVNKALKRKTKIKYKIDEQTQQQRVNDAEQKIASEADAKNPKKLISTEKIALMLKHIPSELATIAGLKKDLSHFKANEIFKFYGEGTAKELQSYYKLATELAPGVMVGENGQDASEEDVQTVLGRPLPKEPELREEMLTSNDEGMQTGSQQSEYDLAA